MNHHLRIQRVHDRYLRHGLVTVAAVVGLGALAACDDDDDTTAATAAPATTPTTTPTTDAAADGLEASPNDPYCDIERQIDAHFVDAFEALGDAPTEDQMMQAVQTAAAAVVADGLIEQATAIAPEALTEDLALLTDAVRSAADGDVSGFMTPESDAAGARVDAFCGLED
jgi:hypothetical protein